MTLPVSTDLLEALPVAVYMTDAEGHITYYNPAAAEFWGYKPELGSKWCGSWRLYYPDGRILPHDECPMAVTLRTGEPVRGVEAICERPDGSRIRFIPYPTPFKDADGKVTGAINLLTDITDRHEAQLQSIHLGAIVASSDDAIVSKTLEGIVTSWNAGAVRIFGYEPDEMIGRHITRIIPPELHGEEADILARLKSGGRIDHYETVRLAKDGRRIDISLTVSALRNKLGQIIGASKIARDITERKRAERTQHLLVSELNHRVKNTLATVQALASQSLNRARSPAIFVSSFTGRLHALAKANALLTDRTWEGAELMDLIRDQLLVGGADQDRFTCDGPVVVLEPQPALHLALILHELGTNARKHGALSVSGGHVDVSWEVRTSGKRQLFLEWRESGGPAVVVPSEHGFGTTLIKRGLDPHGGEVSVRYGATGISCEIRLPLQDRAPSQLRFDPSGKGVGDVALHLVETPQARGRRILLIEDEPLVAMDIARVLSEGGYEVVGPAGNIDSAARLIETEECDAALLDASLAGEPVDRLAAELTKQRIPFAFVSGYGRDALPPAFREALLIGKPFTQDGLLAAVGQLLASAPAIIPLKRKSSALR